ncbi:Uu.00g021350.m01.CDS01 [Anthostomella pinea]|uniref:phosphatidylinositol-3,4,5-trisphosphate 3-phosphatase n=1 Tax=Anthostomella pinea TaxID=933095 RepID=A0AAI8YQY8_9PEZI|nr:Uu.00g021350.m01.CDS01 [Anthostomella pinea]
MASLLRQIVAGPRARHPEAGLDLCYVTDNIIATSGPSQSYPQRAYRNPLDQLVAFLDSKHGKDWAIWEFRGEGTGYPDSLVYNRIRHYPWPDHHPPPFRLVPMIVASMRNWLSGNDLAADGVGASDEGKKNIVSKVLDTWKDNKNGRVVVVHCKAGKGRSGSMACSFLIAECGWTPEQALARFTERRMRPKFGAGVSIPSQLRWIGYVDRWTKGGKKYTDRQLEIVEIHVWGLRNGVKLSVEGFVEEGKKIKVFHTYNKKERLVVEGNPPGSTGMMDQLYDMAGYGTSPTTEQEVLDEAKEVDAQNGTDFVANSSGPSGGPTSTESKGVNERTPTLISKVSRSASTHSKTGKPKKSVKFESLKSANSSSSSLPNNKEKSDPEPGGMAVIFKSHKPVRIPNSDVNIAIERRNRTPSTMGLTMVSAVAHVWFNAFFEGKGPEQDGIPNEHGVFEIEWDKLDGIKGSSQKGTRACDKIAVVWRSVAPEDGAKEPIIHIPGTDSSVPQMKPADWKGGNDEDPDTQKHLGLRVQSPDSANVSQASSIRDEPLGENESKEKEIEEAMAGLRTDVPGQGDDSASSVGSSGQEKGKGVEGKKSDEEKLDAYAEKLPKPEGSGEL